MSNNNKMKNFNPELHSITSVDNDSSKKHQSFFTMFLLMILFGWLLVIGALCLFWLANELLNIADNNGVTDAAAGLGGLGVMFHNFMMLAGGLIILLAIFLVFLVLVLKKYKLAKKYIVGKRLVKWSIIEIVALLIVTILTVLLIVNPNMLKIRNSLQTYVDVNFGLHGHELSTVNAEQTSQQLISALEENGYTVKIGTDSPAYKLDNYSFYSYARNGYSAEIVTKGSKPEGTSKLLKNMLFDKMGFTGVYSAPFEGLYVNQTTVCGVSPERKAAFRCADFTEYEPVARQIQPFATISPEIDIPLVDQPLYRLKALHDSSIKPYQYAELEIDNIEEGGYSHDYNHPLFFYRTDQSSDWQYLKVVNHRGDERVYCDRFNTIITQQAFADLDCETYSNVVMRVGDFHGLFSENDQ